MSEPCGAVDCEGPEMECHCVEPPVPLCKHQTYNHFLNITANPHTIKPYKSKVGIQDAAEIMSAIEKLLKDTRKTKTELLKFLCNAKKAIERKCNEFMETINEAEKLCQDLKLALSEENISTKNTHQNFVRNILLHPKKQRDEIFGTWKQPKLSKKISEFYGILNKFQVEENWLEISCGYDPCREKHMTKTVDFMTRNNKSFQLDLSSMNATKNQRFYNGFLGYCLDPDLSVYQNYARNFGSFSHHYNQQNGTTIEFGGCIYSFGQNGNQTYKYETGQGTKRSHFKNKINRSQGMIENFPGTVGPMSAVIFYSKIYICSLYERDIFVFDPDEEKYSVIKFDFKPDKFKLIFRDESHLYVIQENWLYKLTLSFELPNEVYTDCYKINNFMGDRIPLVKPVKFKNKFHFIFDESAVFCMDTKSYAVKQYKISLLN